MNDLQTISLRIGKLLEDMGFPAPELGDSWESSLLKIERALTVLRALKDKGNE